MKTVAGIWIASLPRSIEGRKILDVEFISPSKRDIEKWASSFPFTFHIPEDKLLQNKIQESLLENLHLAIMEVDVENDHIHDLIEVAEKIVYPKIRRAVLAIDISSYTGHIYISPEIMIEINKGTFSTWIGRATGRPQGEPYEDIIELMEKVFRINKDPILLRRLERALIKWSELQEEPNQTMRIAELWSVLDAILHKYPEPVKKTILRRCINLLQIESRESINLFSDVGWRAFFTDSSDNLKKVLNEAYEIRNDVYHDAEDPDVEIGFALKFNSLVQVIILKIAEFACSEFTWQQIIEIID